MNLDQSETLAAAVTMTGAASLLLTCFGVAYALPVFFPLVGKALMIPAWHLTAVFSVAGALYYSIGVISGPIADRFGARVIASVGCCVLASGLVVASLARSELGLDVGYLLGVGVGVGLCFVPAVGAVQVLCPKNPALAGGVAASGIGVGTLVVPVVAQLMIDRLGWREAMQLIGVLAACGGLAALPLRRPAQTEVIRDDARRDVPGTLALDVQYRRQVVLLYLAQLMVGLVVFVPFAHLVPFAEAQGWTATGGVYLISLIGIGSICGRILLGLVADSLGSCCTAALCAGGVALSLMLLPLLPRGWELGVDVALFGLGYGGFNALTGPMVAEVLGVRGICRSVGWVVTSRALGILIGPWAVALAVYRFGHYSVSFFVCAALAFAAALLLGSLGRVIRGHRNEVFAWWEQGRPLNTALSPVPPQPLGSRHG